MARKSRKKKKAIKKLRLAYDVSSVPRGLPFDEVWSIFKQTGLLLYDSTKGQRPQQFNFVGKQVKIVDKSYVPYLKHYNNGREH